MSSYPVPYYAEVNNGIPRGGEIELHGEVTSGGEQAIWFELRSNDGIVVHINVRFGRMGHHAVVINSYEKGKWKHEDRHKVNFRPGQMIHIIVTNEMLHWKIQINGEKYNFSHRLSSSDISRLEIRGDIRIGSLNFRNLSGHIDHRPIPSSTYRPHFEPIAYEPSSFTDHSGGMIGAGGGNNPHGGGSGIGAGGGVGGGYGQNYQGGAGGIGAGQGVGGGYGQGGIGAGTGNLHHSGGVGAGLGYPTGGGYAGGVGAGHGNNQYGPGGYNQGPQPTGGYNQGQQGYNQGPQPTGGYNQGYNSGPRPSGPY